MVTSADVVAAALYRSGVRHGFVIPGGEVLTFIDALDRAGIELVTGRHENACGFMAEGAFRATGAPGLLVVTVGPGVANAVTSVANADQERVPLIVVSGKVDEAVTLGFNHQIFDHRAVLAPFCKASYEVREGAADLAVDKAIHLAGTGRPGPVHLDLPMAVATAPHPPHRGSPPAAPSPAVPAPGPTLDRVAERFAASRRPLLLLGQEAVGEPGAAEAVTRFVERNQVPVITTYKAKGLLDEWHPLALGGHGLSPRSDAVVLPLLAEADLVVAAGYDPIEMRQGWRDPVSPDRLVSFTTNPNDHFMHREGATWAVGTVAGLVALGPRSAPDRRWIDGPVARARAELAATATPTGWGPVAALLALQDAVVGRPGRQPDHPAVVTVDSGAHRILLSQIWRCRRPGTLLQSSGLCTMGAALPLAIGHAAAAPGTRVVAVLGDGCLDMMLGELATLRDLDLPVTVIVLVDGTYELIAKKQRAEGLPARAVAVPVTDYVEVARAIGLAAEPVTDEASLTGALVAGADRPMVLTIPIEPGAYDDLI